MKMLLFFLLLCNEVFATSYAGTNNEPKEATQHTKNLQEGVLKELPFENKADFDNISRGFIASSDASMSFDFITDSPAPDTVNPSLWRQAQLNNMVGLFKVVEGIYQVRGFDLANITFIRGDDGWIVVDPLTIPETAKEALDLFRKHVSNDPISAVIFTHSHVDHFGGIRGVVTDEDIENGVEIIAPEHFFEESISENLLAGNVMSRRSGYMYGLLLPKNEKGVVDAGLGKGLALGVVGIMEPTKDISEDYETYVVDGVEFEFLMAQDTEAPAEFMFYLPQFKAASSAEVINHTFHNISTLRGAKTRNSINWANSIDKTSAFLAGRTDVLFGSHHWPTWGQENIDKMISKHGDMYRYIHDQTLRLANHGYTLLEIPEMIEIPDSLAHEFYNRDYYGTVTHNVKAIYDFYFGGWWDGNPANLYKHQPEEAAVRYVDFMGGEESIIRKAKEYYEKGDYRFVVEVLNHVIFANENNQEARNVSADAMEQLAYQSESAPWRAYFLTGALELRHGVQPFSAPSSGSPDIIRALPIESLFADMAVRLNPTKVKGEEYAMNLIIDGETFLLYTEHDVLKYKKEFLAGEVTVEMTRSVFNKLLSNTLTQEEILISMKISNVQYFVKFMSCFDQFDLWFDVVLP